MDQKKKDEILFLAASEGLLQTIKGLIQDGVNVKAKNNRRWTALMLAIENNNLGIVKFLESKGAKVNTKKKNNRWTELIVSR